MSYTRVLWVTWDGLAGSSSSPGPTTFLPLAVAPWAPLGAALDAENVLVTVQTGQTGRSVLTVPVAEILTKARFCCRTDQSVTHAALGHGQQFPAVQIGGYTRGLPVT